MASFFNRKAKFWLNGRENWRYLLASHFQPPHDEIVVWVHCASLGEFEQGRPVIEAIKMRYPHHKIVLTFFSPSGYEIRKNYPFADFVCYLPLDSKANARDFIRLVKPNIAIFVKYEFWYYYLNELKNNNIPTFLIAALFRPNQLFFKRHTHFFQKMLFCFTHIFTQNQLSADLLKKINYKNYSIAGDPRIDRVLQIAAENKTFPLIEAFAQNHKILIAGSTWQQDEAILAQYINENPLKNWKYIIAPHEINDAHLAQIERKLTVNTIRFSKISLKTAANYQVLIIDNIGMLNALYKYGTIAYIGGGFGNGIHNTLEPIAFGLPVFFGTNYTKFEEAIYLVAQKGAFCISSVESLKNAITSLDYAAASAAAQAYVLANKGATEKIMLLMQNENLF